MSEDTGGDVGDGGGAGGGVGPGGGGTGGTPTSGLVTVLSKTITLPVSGVVDVDGAAKQGFSAIPAAWKFELYIDGTLVWAPGGTYPGDVVAIGGALYCAVDLGTHPTGRDVTVELKWGANSHVTLQDRFLKIRGFNNVVG